MATTDSALLLEPWLLMDLAKESYAERANAARAMPRISHKTCGRFGATNLSTADEFEIGLQYIFWMATACSPIIALAWAAIAPSALSVTTVCIVAASMVWPSAEWPVPPWSRLACPIRNRQVVKAFIKYFPMRCVVEDPDSMLNMERPAIFGGVPHGLFPIGMALLGFCNFCLPWKRIRCATASVVLRTPLWRTVSLWNGAIDVSRKAITGALRAGDNVIVALDGIAGIFEQGCAHDTRMQVGSTHASRQHTRKWLACSVPLVVHAIDYLVAWPHTPSHIACAAVMREKKSSS